MAYFNYNGKILPEGTAVIGPASRGLRYGDGLFETMKYSNGQLVLADEHFARLWKGMQLLQFPIPKFLTPDLLLQQVVELAAKNKHASARIRLSVMRGDGGLYDLDKQTVPYSIESFPLSPNSAALNENGLQLCIYEDANKTMDAFSNLKHSNFLPYFMGALAPKKQQCNDAVICNTSGRVADTTIANLFLVKDGELYTPPLSEGCIAGVMRKCVIQLLSQQYTIHETPVSIPFLLDAEEVFLTNSIYPIRWVAGIAEKKYGHNEIRKIYALATQTNPSVFC